MSDSFNELFLMVVGYFSEMRNKIEELVKSGKINHDEAQAMFERMNEGYVSNEHLTPLSMSVGFSIYMNKKIIELITDLKKNGKITAEEARKYYLMYLPDQLKKNTATEKKEFVGKSDIQNMLQKIESVNNLINTREKGKGEDTK